MGLLNVLRPQSANHSAVEIGSDGSWGTFGLWPGVINDAADIPYIDQETAEGLPGVGRGVELIAGVISQLQPQLFENSENWNIPTKRLDTPPLLLNPDPQWHPLPSWLAAIVASMAWHGNGYAYRGPEVSDYRGYPTRLPLMEAERIDWDGSQYVYNNTPTPSEIPPGDMLHVAVSPRAGYRLGRGILQRYQSTLKLMVVTEQAQYVVMKDGKPMGILSLGVDVTPDEAAEYKQGFLKAVAESGVAAIGNADFKPVQWSAADLSMIPTREFNLRLASDITGVPPYLLGVPSESRVYANMETEWANFIRVTLGRYLSPLEHALSTCFPKGKVVHFSTDQLLRSDTAARWAVYKTADEIGAMTRDEIREMERMPPLTDEQKAELDSKTAPAPAPAAQPDPTQEEPDAGQ